MTRRALAIAFALAAAVCGCREQGARAPSPAPAPPDAVEPAASGPTGTQPAVTLPRLDLGYNGREGRALFEHYCSTCHGTEGHGDGFNAYNLDPKPRDLADPAFQAERSDQELAAIVRTGGAAAGLSTGMPPWGRTLNERQIDNVVGFLRTLAAPGFGG
jgi:mono/diheme cytochrome c family protein